MEYNYIWYCTARFSIDQYNFAQYNYIQYGSSDELC